MGKILIRSACCLVLIVPVGFMGLATFFYVSTGRWAEAVRTFAVFVLFAVILYATVTLLVSAIRSYREHMSEGPRGFPIEPSQK